MRIEETENMAANDAIAVGTGVMRDMAAAEEGTRRDKEEGIEVGAAIESRMTDDTAMRLEMDDTGSGKKITMMIDKQAGGRGHARDQDHEAQGAVTDREMEMIEEE